MSLRTARPRAIALVAAVLIAGAAYGLAGHVETAASPGTGSETAEVVRVVDGDTLVVNAGSHEETVRLIGIDSPESAHPDESRNCEEGRAASEHMKSLVLPGEAVYMTSDVSETDRYGRLLRYVWLDEPSDEPSEAEAERKMLNVRLIVDGYAQAKEYPPDTKWGQLFSRLGERALAEGAGVTSKWS